MCFQLGAGDVESEAREDDALLPQPDPQISVISSNDMESASVFVVNLTESEQGGSPMLTVVETQVLPSTSSQDVNNPASN